MGGKALLLERIPRQQYFLKKSEINNKIILDGRLQQLDILMWEDDTRIDFGDIDLYFLGNHTENVEIAKELFLPSTFVENDLVFSMEVDGLQVDIITVKNSFAPAFYSLALGITMGRFFKRHGLIMGVDGLYIPLGPNKLILTQDPEEFFCFIGEPDKPFHLIHDRKIMIRQIYDSWIYDHDTNFPETRNSKERKNSKHHFVSDFLEETSHFPKKHGVDSRFEYALDYFKKRETYTQMKKSMKLLEIKDHRKTNVKKLLMDVITSKGFVKEQISQKLQEFKKSIENFEEWIQVAQDEVIKESLELFLMEL
jgi:hypothetical protein